MPPALLGWRHVGTLKFLGNPVYAPLTCLAEESVCLLHDGRIHDGVEECVLLSLLRARVILVVIHVLVEENWKLSYATLTCHVQNT